MLFPKYLFNSVLNCWFLLIFTFGFWFLPKTAVLLLLFPPSAKLWSTQKNLCPKAFIIGFPSYTSVLIGSAKVPSFVDVDNQPEQLSLVAQHSSTKATFLKYF